jgi:hypothetical protein
VAAGFVFNEIWVDYSTGRSLKALDVTIPSGYGGATNTIAAACFGLATVEEAHCARISSSNKVFLAGPSYDRTKLYLYDITNATDASRNSPADTGAATRLIVKGKE